MRVEITKESFKRIISNKSKAIEIVEHEYYRDTVYYEFGMRLLRRENHLLYRGNNQYYIDDINS